MPQLVILPGLIDYKRCMGPMLNDGAFVKYSDLVAELTAGKAVADVDRGLVTGNVVEFGVDLCLRNGIQSRGGLIQDEKGNAIKA